MADRQEEIRRDVEILREFTGLYCRKNHGRAAGELCDSCRETLEYAIERRTQCPMVPKPACRNCPNPCYREPHRGRIKKIMRFGAMHLLKRGQVHKLIKLSFGRKK